MNWPKLLSAFVGQAVSLRPIVNRPRALSAKPEGRLQIGRRLKTCPTLLLTTLALAASLHATTYCVTVAGLGGEPDYDQRFSGWIRDIDNALKSAPDTHVDALTGAASTKAHLETTLSRIAGEAKQDDELILVLIGHGSFDDVDYKFNLPGPDITAAELAKLLDRIPAHRQLVVNTTSCSGASRGALEKNGRIVVTATKSGTERNATVFARYWAAALSDPAADTDKNQVISALEAFKYAEQKTVQFYEQQKRLATEHALLDDTGKGEGTRDPSPQNGEGRLASQFALVRFGAAQQQALDPHKRELLAHKDELEQQIDALKYDKAALPTDEYKKKLTTLLLDLARTQAELDK